MAIAFVQGVSVQSTGATSVTTPSMTTVAANALFGHVGMVNAGNFSGTSPIADTSSNTWANAWFVNTANSKGALFFSLGIAGGAGYTATFTLPGSSSACAFELTEFSGVNGGLDQAASTSSSASPRRCGSITTTTPNQLVIGSGYASSVGGLPVSIGLFTDVYLTDSSPEGAISGHAIVNAAAAYTYAFRYNNAQAERVGIATFKGTGIAFVQSQTVQSSGATSVTTAAIATTAGHFLSALATSFTRTFSGSPITDSVGLTWPAAWAGANAGQYYSENIPGNATHTITATPPGGSSACALIVTEYSGVDASSSLDKTASASSATEPHTSGATATTSQAHELLLGGGSISHTSNPPYSTVVGDWVDAVALNPGNFSGGGIIAYQILSGIATLDYGFSYAKTSGANAVGVASFKATVNPSGVTISAPSVDGAGVETVTGAGSVTIGAPAVQGSPFVSGEGGVSISPPTADGAGAATDTSNRVEIGAPSVAGSGTVVVVGTGGVAIGVATVSAAGSAPAPTPPWSTNRLYTAPPAATGRSITPSSTSWAWSNWVELEASTAAAWLLSSLIVTPNQTGPFQEAATVEIEVGVGAAGFEIPVDRFRGHWGTWAYASPGELPRPVLLDAIASHTRVALRLRKNNTSVVPWHVSATYYRKPLTGAVLSSAVTQKTVPDGANNATLTLSSSLWANPTNWTTVIVSAAKDLLLVGIIPAATGVASDWEVDVGVGATPAVITTVRFHHTGFLPIDGPTLIPLYQPLSAIPSGSKVSMRPRHGSNIGGGVLAASLIYMELPL